MSDNKIYPIDKIMRKRTRKAKVEYLVKWKNYDDTHNSWEPADNFLDSSALRAFNKKTHEEKKNSRKSDSSSSDSPPEKVTPKSEARKNTRRSGPVKKLPISPAKKKGRPSNDKTSPVVKYTNGHSKSESESSGTSSADDEEKPCIKKLPVVRGSFRTIDQVDEKVEQVKDPNTISTKETDDMTSLEELKPNETFEGTTEASVGQTAEAANDGKADFTTTAAAVEATPPTLQVMVSGSELWLITERNHTRQKYEEPAPLVQTAASQKSGDFVENDLPANVPAPKDAVIPAATNFVAEKRVDIVLTDIKAHDYSVVFKECYNSDEFFEQPVVD